MDALFHLGRTLGFSFTAGINLYATVAVLGLAARHDWVTLPPGFEAFDHDVVIGLAIGLYLVEFFADKIPWVDTAWDVLHTLVRPIGGALVAVVALGEAAPFLQIVAALLGGSVALTTHAAKAGTRVAVNASPEPVSNTVLSLAEDVLVLALAAAAIVVPLVALAAVLALLAAIAVMGGRLLGIRRRPGPTAPA